MTHVLYCHIMHRPTSGTVAWSRCTDFNNSQCKAWSWLPCSVLMPHSWQAPSSHLWRATSVILTVRPPLNWTTPLQYNGTYNPLQSESHFFASVLTRVAKIRMGAARDLLFEPKRSSKGVVGHLITYLLYAGKPTLSSSITSQRYSLAIMLRPFCPYSSLCVKLIPTHSIIITFCRFPSLLCSRHTLDRHHDISLSFQTFLSQPSSCLSDQEGDDIYDFAGKYRSSLRHHQAKILMTPQG